jgi:hypothetical protein
LCAAADGAIRVARADLRACGLGPDPAAVGALVAAAARGGRCAALLLGENALGDAGVVAVADALAKDAGAIATLDLGRCGCGAGGDAWEAAVEALRTARPGLDVAWRAADAGEAEKAKERGAFAEAR